MANNHDKPWSCQELIDSANNWTLAGNVGLLKHLEHFVDNLFQQAEETNNNLEDLLNDLDSTEIQLDLAKNQFLGLQNTQFIESRVYEDDETINNDVEELKETKLDDANKHQLMQGAVLDGLQVLDKYHERVSIPESDSEGDEPDCPNYILREKDPYISRPLPYIIGTEEWHTKWHAGLEDSSDDEDDTGKKRNTCIEDEFSDTDSESNLPNADQTTYNTEFIDNNGLDNASNYVNYDEVNGNSISAQTPVPSATFAEQLAAKLGDVLTKPGTTNGNQQIVDPEVNTRPLQRRPISSSLLPDMPPLLTTDTEEATTSGLFSGGGGLFDDDDDDDAGEKPPPIAQVASKPGERKERVPNLFDDDDEEDVSPPSNSRQTTIQREGAKKSIGGLFDESDEEDIFSNATSTTNNLFFNTPKSGPQFLPQEPPTLKKAPIGGVKVLSGVLPKRQSSSSSSESDDDSKMLPPKIENTSTPNNQPASLITPKSSLKSEDTPVPSPRKTASQGKHVISLFDDTDDLFEDDLFADKPSSSVKEKTSSGGLFDSLDKEDTVPPPLFTTSSQKKKQNLFDESSDEDNDNNNIFNQPIASLPQDNSSKDNNSNPKNISLFDDIPDMQDDDLWSQEPSIKEDATPETVNTSIASTIKSPKIDEIGKATSFNLFDSKPPILTMEDDDESLDTKSNRSSSSLSDKIPVLADQELIKSEMPSFSTSEEVKIPPKTEITNKNTTVETNSTPMDKPEKKLPGKIKHNLNINVNTLMPGAKLVKPKLVESSETSKESEKPVETPRNVSVNSENKNNQEQNKQVDADNNNLENVEVLQSITKNRAKIMVKRRPSTRQGRKAALAKLESTENPPKMEEAIIESPPKLNEEHPKTTPVIQQVKNPDENLTGQDGDHEFLNEIIEKPPDLNLFDANDDEDIFAGDIISTAGKNTMEKSNIDDKDIFGGFSNVNTPNSKPKSSLFGILNDQDDDDLFAPSSTMISNSNAKQNIVEQATPTRKRLTVDDDLEDVVKPPPLTTQPETIKPVKKISLFDDLADVDDDDDNIFATCKSYARKNKSTDVGNVRVFGDNPLAEPSAAPEKKPPMEAMFDTKIAKSAEPDDIFEAPPPMQKSTDIFNPTKIQPKKDALKFLEDDDDDLFGDTLSKSQSRPSSAVVASTGKKTSSSKTRSLFDDDDDADDDLFGGTKVKPLAKPAKESKSLFGDEDDDDDLFSMNKSSKKPPGIKSGVVRPVAVQKTKVSTAAVTKLSKDPLAALLGDSD